jgi:hypothetical protein
MEGGRFEAYIIYLAAACRGSHWKNIKLKAAKTGSQPLDALLYDEKTP